MKRIFALMLAVVTAFSASAFMSNDAQLPLYVVDGKAISLKEFQALPTSEIESMTILKSTDNVEKFKHLGDTSNGVIVVTLKGAEEEDLAFITVDVMPSFMGGDLVAFRNWVMQNVRYPEAAMMEGKEDMVVANFIVNRHGYIEYDDINILQSNHPAIFAKEVKRVISTSPRWTPGFNNGRAVSVSFTLPVIFSFVDKAESTPKQNDVLKIEGESVEEIVVRALGSNSKQLPDKAPIYIIDGALATAAEVKALDAADIKQVTMHKEEAYLEYYKMFGDTSNGVMFIHTVSIDEGVEPNPDTQPSFMDSSWDGFYMWVCQNLKYPEQLKSDKIRARLSVKFIVNDKGYLEVYDIMTIDGTAHPLFHDEVRRVMLSSPQWKPATKGGKAVACYCVMPVNFEPM